MADLTRESILEAVRVHGSLGAAAAALGIARSAVAAVLRDSGTRNLSSARSPKDPEIEARAARSPERPRAQESRTAKAGDRWRANVADYLASGTARGNPSCGHDIPERSCPTCVSRVNTFARRGRARSAKRAAKLPAWTKRVAVYLRDREGRRPLKCGHEPPQADCTYCVKIVCGFEARLRNRRRAPGEKKPGRPIQHNMVGETFGGLKVIALTNRRYRGHVIYVCRCVCGAEIDVARKQLISGNTASCGCVGRSEASRKRAATMGPEKLSLSAKKAVKTKRRRSLDAWRAARPWKGDS